MRTEASCGPSNCYWALFLSQYDTKLPNYDLFKDTTLKQVDDRFPMTSNPTLTPNLNTNAVA